MSASIAPSVDDLERESELRRSQLARATRQLREQVEDTADEIKTRITPRHLKNEIKDYVVESSEQWFDLLKKSARANPLQTVAIGAGIAYPLWGLLRSIPVPILLIGAGLLVSKESRKQELANTAADLFAGATEKVSGYASSVQDAAADGANRLSESAADASSAVASGANSVIEKATGLAGDAKSAASGVGEKIIQQINDATSSARAASSDALSTIKDKAAVYSQKSGSAIMDAVEKNPILFAGAGLAIGAFIAACVPSTRTEQAIFGERSDQLKQKAQAAAAGGVERAKDVAAAMVGDVVEAAAREGLDSDGIKRAVEGITSGVKAVAGKGMRAALGEESASAGDFTPPSKS